MRTAVAIVVILTISAPCQSQLKGESAAELLAKGRGLVGSRDLSAAEQTFVSGIAACKADERVLKAELYLRTYLVRRTVDPKIKDDGGNRFFQMMRDEGNESAAIRRRFVEIENDHRELLKKK